MSEELVIVVVCLVGLLVYRVGSRWWRHRRASKQADDLLAKILKGKDAFRR